MVVVLVLIKLVVGVLDKAVVLVSSAGSLLSSSEVDGEDRVVVAVNGEEDEDNKDGDESREPRDRTTRTVGINNEFKGGDAGSLVLRTCKLFAG